LTSSSASAVHDVVTSGGYRSELEAEAQGTVVVVEDNDVNQ
jgi:hypothetical protein